MRFPLTEQLLAEAETFQLRSACRDCRYHDRPRDRCGNEWPQGDQARWPLDAPDAAGSRPQTVDFCREFELY